MSLVQKINANPTVYPVSKPDKNADLDALPNVDDEDSFDEFTAEEVFNVIRYINDPEHPLTLEQLNVTTLDNIAVDNDESNVNVFFTPTIPHCSMATLIGLCIRVKLIRSLPKRFKVEVKISPGTHQSELTVNKQLNDKERVAAALENNHLLDVVNKCIAHTDF